MGYWTVTGNQGSEVRVTNEDNIRRLMIKAPEGTTAENPVIVSQEELALTGGQTYALSFTAEGEAGKSVSLIAAGQNFEFPMTGEEKKYSDKLVLGQELPDTNLAFYIKEPGVFYIDDVRIEEDSLIKNGSFNAGFAGYEAYVDSSADASYVVDSLTEDNAADFTINNTGDAAWKIQLKQNNIELEKDQWYKLTLDAKSSLARKLMFAIQRDGTSDDDWTPYSGEKIVELENGYNTYEIQFQMKNPSDSKAVLSISMGAVGDVQITEKHRICIDNINLEKIEAPAVPEKPAGENLMVNGDFASGEDGWVKAVTAPGEAEVSFAENKAVYHIENVGTEDWNVQLKQEGITLEQGKKYRITFRAASTKARTIKLAMLSQSYTWYGGEDILLEENQEKEVAVEFTMGEETDSAATLVVSMGLIKDGEGNEVSTPASEITMSDFSLVKVE